MADLDSLSLPPSLRELLRDADAQWQQLQGRISAADCRIQEHAKPDEACTRLRAIIGVGPITADGVVATIGSAPSFANGRQFAAWLGLVPMQHSSGGRTRLGRISCRGDGYLRTLLIQDARSTCSAPRRWLGKRQHRSNAGSRLSNDGFRLQKCWSPSPTNMRASYGRCWHAASTTIPTRG